MQVEMIVEKGIYLRRRREFCITKSMVCLVIFIIISLISTSEAIKCYVCGISEDSLLELSNINKTFQTSCEDFDRIPLEEKYKYETECPGKGCMLKVGANVERTCSEFGLDDCKTVNKIHFCYCNRKLCNGENAESIIEKLGDVQNEEDEEVDEEFEDESSGSDDQDDEDYNNYRTTMRKTDSETDSTTEGKFTVLSVSADATTELTTANKAVTSNLSKNFLMFLSFAQLFIICRDN